MKHLIPLFLLTGCTIGLQPIEPIGETFEDDEDNDQNNAPDSSPNTEPSWDTNTNDTDSGAEPSDTNDENLIPNLISSISPAYGSTNGGTEITIIGGPFSGDARVTIGGYPATLLSNMGSQIRVSTPMASVEATAEVRVDMDAGFGISPIGFHYFEDGTNQSGAFGQVEMIEFLGGYWLDGNGNPITNGAKEGSFFIGFHQPADFQWWQFYTPTMDSCAKAGIDADGDDIYDNNDYYTYSGEIMVTDIGTNTLTLSSQSIQTLSRGSSSTEDINYFFYQVAGLPEAAIIDNSFFSLDIPSGTLEGLNIPQFARASKRTVPSSPVMTGADPMAISSTQTFTWNPSGGDWIQIQMYHRNSLGFVDSNIRCIAQDDGVFTISNFHQNWVYGETIYIMFSRIFESNTRLPYNNAESRVTGVYTVIGAGIMN